MQLSDWIPRWIVDKNSQIRGTLGCFVLTEAQAIAWQPRFFCPPCGCLSRTPHSRETKPFPDEIDTSSGWQTARISWVAPASTIRLRRIHFYYHQCKWECRPDTRWRRCQASPQGSCWCTLGSLLGRSLDRKASLGTRSDRIESWTRSSTRPLCGFSFDGRHWWGWAGWIVLLFLAYPTTPKSAEMGTGS